MPFTLCEEYETIQRIADNSVLGPKSPVWNMNYDPNHTSVAVAGSFLLWCRYKEASEVWKYNDIDVWCDDDDVYNQVVGMLYDLVGAEVTEVSDKQCHIGLYNVVNLGTLKYSTPHYVTMHFDMPVLNGYYNGCELYVNEISNDLLRYGGLSEDVLPNTPVQLARVQKYVERGFKRPLYYI